MRMLVMVVVSLLVVSPTRVDAEAKKNWLVGPVLGIRLSGQGGSRGVLGVEGGVGIGPERVNLGVEHRDGKLFGYLELDPWLLVGASIGLGVDSDGQVQPALGVWEGIPHKLGNDPCYSSKYDAEVIVAVGYRYTGVHELLRHGQGRGRPGHMLRPLI
ncbi:MAG: hypothetical protein E6J90_24010 [Deltaproteobacteria bacterium]|nr:MAG: hypothetical protein E6J91_30910 [Deltaproteobacteria bacterium]TMQ16318.1 MAG: hypothetical protein E6J90_24010 [Deltaproteobacteria bacterium]